MDTTIQRALTLNDLVTMMLLSVGVKEERIKPTYTFYDDMELDILQHLHLIDLVEKYFHIHIEDELAERIYTPNDLQQVITQKIATA